MTTNEFQAKLEAEISQLLDVVVELASDKANIAENINAISNCVAHIECNFSQIDQLKHPKSSVKLNFTRGKEIQL